MRAALAAVPLLLSACSSTRLISERVGPATLEQPLRRLVVLGVSEDVDQRVRFEKAFGAAVRRRTAIDAVAATALIAPEHSLDYQTLRGVVEDAGFDAVLVVRKLGERADVTEVRTGTGIPDVEVTAYDDFHGRYLRTIRSGTTEHVTRMVRAEVTLLRTGDYAEVWTGATDSRDPRDLDRVARELAEVTVEQLLAHGIL